MDSTDGQVQLPWPLLEAADGPLDGANAAIEEAASEDAAVGSQPPLNPGATGGDEAASQSLATAHLEQAQPMANTPQSLEDLAPLPPPLSPSDEISLVPVPRSPSPSPSQTSGFRETQSSAFDSPMTEGDADVAGFPVKHQYEGLSGHGLLRLEPTPAQWADFPALLALARRLGAAGDGCFKIVLPSELRDVIPIRAPRKFPANAYRVRQVKQRMFWQVSTVPSEAIFPDEASQVQHLHQRYQYQQTANEAIKSLKALFIKNKDRQMRNVRYRVDVPAWTPEQRLEAGVPQRSPIHPLPGDRLVHTKAIIPGIHTPYVYESGPHFGASFQLHAEDFRLASLNHLYRGRKIWIVIPATAVHVAEEAFNRKERCSQFMRHRAEFFFPERLDKMGIPYRVADQRPGETMVILPDAYHEGFSTGYTLAEAKNYADAEWTAETYQPCRPSCRLLTAIPAEYMRPVEEGEARIDLCVGYDVHEPVQVSRHVSKRMHDDEDGPEREAKQAKTD